jgi:hypothetical protein
MIEIILGDRSILEAELKVPVFARGGPKRGLNVRTSNYFTMFSSPQICFKHPICSLG